MTLNESMHQLRDDAAYALRILAKSPSFSAVALLTLALGTGATTAIFSVVRAVVLRPLPIAGVEQTVRIYETNPSTNSFATSEPNFLDFRDKTHSFSAMGAFTSRRLSLVGRGDPVQLTGVAAAAGYFGVIAAKPILGTVYGPDNDKKGADTRVIVLSEGIWRSVFGSDKSVVGSTLNLDGDGYRVVGVIPSTDSYLPADFWIPLAASLDSPRGNHPLFAVGRLKNGVTIQQAEADIKAVAAQLSILYPKSNGDWGVRLAPLEEWIQGPNLPKQMLMLLGAVCFVLLLACANVGNLLLVRATARQRELSVRAALGASRQRLIRQLFTESAVLALVGSALGLALAAGTVPLLRHFSPGNIPRLEEASLDLPVLAFALGIAGLTAIVFGVVPAFLGSRSNLQASLRQSARSVSKSGRETRNALVVSEVALAVVLLVGAGLMGKSFQNLRSVTTGFQADNILQLTIASATNLTREQRVLFFDQVGAALAAIPGVTDVGATSVVPFAAQNSNTQFIAEGRGDKDFFAANFRTVNAGFFRTIGVPLKAGRLLEPTDVFGHPRVAVIDSIMAQRLWPNGDALGKYVMVGQSARGPDDRITIVGIVGSVRDLVPALDPAPTLYITTAQRPWPFLTFLLKTRGSDPTSVIAGARRALRETAPTTPIPEITALAGNFTAAIAPRAFTTSLLVSFAGVALLLAGIGIYGVISYSVAQRTQEMGIRLALGAAPRRIATMVVRDGGLAAVIGVIVGSAAALGLSRFVTAILFGTSGTNIGSYALAAVVALGAAALASYIPARRAARVDPLVAIRSD